MSVTASYLNFHNSQIASPFSNLSLSHQNGASRQTPSLLPLRALPLSSTTRAYRPPPTRSRKTNRSRTDTAGSYRVTAHKRREATFPSRVLPRIDCHRNPNYPTSWHRGILSRSELSINYAATNTVLNYDAALTPPAWFTSLNGTWSLGW